MNYNEVKLMATYVSPEVTVIEVNETNIICASNQGSFPLDGDGTIEYGGDL